MVHRRNKFRLGILVSGRGSNLQALIDASKKKEIDAEVVVVISNNPKAFALERAKKHKIPAIAPPDQSEKAFINILKQYDVDLVCLAGFMKILSPAFLKAFPKKIINIHPALLPAFPGLQAQKQAFDYGVKVTGVTVHFVDEGCDTGPIILQSPVVVQEDDTLGSLTERLLKEEHKSYPKAIQLLATERLKIAGRRVIQRKK